MNISDQIGGPEGHFLEYKAVLLPPKAMATLIASFANADGGTIVLGVSELQGKPEIVGISREFRISTVLSRATEYLSPEPVVTSEYIEHSGKNLFCIYVEKSQSQVKTADGKVYVRVNASTTILNNQAAPAPTENSEVAMLLSGLNLDTENITQSLSDFIEHVKSLVDIINNVYSSYFTDGIDGVTVNNRGKVLTRVLFSSFADNFEVYMSSILHEIYLSNPNTLKSDEMVKVKDVLKCQDLQEFVEFWARTKISKLQKGSVKGFMNENKQIKQLNVITDQDVDDLEKVLQIRHLFTHANGIIDEKFLRYFGNSYTINEEFTLSLRDMFGYLKKVVTTVKAVDHACVQKFDLGGL
jgi:hypothetical protein